MTLQEKIFWYGKKVVPVGEGGIPSEDMKEVIDFMELEKGSLTYAKGEKYPIRGNMASDNVYIVARAKRLIPLIFRFIGGKEEFTKTNIFQKGVRVIAVYLCHKLIIAWLYFYLKETFYENPDRYVQIAREMYRVIDDKTIRNITCSFLENDDTYRYIFQDIVYELNKEKFNEDPIAEIKRLAELMFSRQISDSSVYRLRIVMPYLLTYLKLRPSIVSQLKAVVSKINLEEVKSSVEDIYWQNKSKYYNFRGLSYDQRSL